MISQKGCRVEFMGLPVGYLAYTDDSGYASFEYDKEWLANGFSIAPIHLPLQAGVFRFNGLPKETFRGLPAAFADSLPDDFGHALIDAWLARSGIPKAEFSAIDRLLYTGSRAMGALEYQTSLEVMDDASTALHLADLVELAQKVLDEREQLSISPSQSDAMTHLLQIGTSAGGARPKAVIAMNADKTHIVSGQTEVPEGYTHYLLKFDGIEQHRQDQENFGDPQGFGLMEYAYHLMAVDCGINMEPCGLLKENGRHHFYTKRFDREGNQKYHMQTLCAMDHADFRKPGFYSYEELFAVARQLNLSVAEQTELFRRMVFNVVARNHDDHTKNFAFLVNDDFEWVLAPAYDIAYSYKPDSFWVNTHQMTINGKRDNFTRDDLYAVGRAISRFTPAKMDKIIDHTIAVVRQWPDYARQVGVFKGLREQIQSHLRLHL